MTTNPFCRLLAAAVLALALAGCGSKLNEENFARIQDNMTEQQVIDLLGKPIPVLYAGGEAVGGFNKHGLGKGHVHGFIAGTFAGQEQPGT